MEYLRGSEWRIWDLHFHTPASHDYKDKSVTNKDLIDGLANNKVSVIAITDHHVMDIERIEELKKLGKEKDITILPGIEFCSELGGSEAIHYIGIFSENANLNTIWTKIQGQCGLTQDEVSEKGAERICCPFEKTSALIMELGGIITVHAGKKSNSIESIKNNLLVKQELKQQLLSTYHPLLEIGKIEDEADYKKKVFPEIKFSLPIIMCSDNHNIREYSVKSPMWIKANPTFEGLKQILFEPDSRVCISEVKPEPKSSYQIIDHVELNESGFWKQKLYLNQNLNTIIGGRSTGKSTLLASIAHKFGITNSLEDTFIKEHKQNIRVIWADNIEDYDRDIEFFRQSHMFDIAKDKEETNKLLMNIIRDRKEFNDAINTYESRCSSLTSDIQFKINRLSEVFSKAKEKQKEIRQLGDEKGIKEEIKKLESERKSIYESIKDENALIENFTKSMERIQVLENSNRSLLQEISNINSLKGMQHMYINFNNYVTRLSEKYKITFQQKAEAILLQANNEISNILDCFIKENEKELSKQKDEITTIINSENYKKGKVIWDNNKRLSDIDKRLAEEKKKLEEIQANLSIFTLLKSEINSLRESIINTHFSYLTECENLSKVLQLTHDGIDIKAVPYFEVNKLNNTLESLIDLRSQGMRNLLNDFSIKYREKESAKDFILDFIKKVNNEKVTIKGYNSPTDLLHKILASNWYQPQIQLFYENDTFDGMSQGKQAFVILKLLLDFSNKQCPILIDQPEDSLDNRAIYKELVKYIRLKKVQRQIILVTHNPNVVVGADSELVIIANQQGTKTPNKDDIKFQYKEGSLEDSSPVDDNKDLPILDRMGIREHVCEILEGGEEAFANREKKYGFRL